MTRRVLVVQHEERVPLGRLTVIDGLQLEVVRPDLGQQLPADAAGFDGLIVLGGSMAAWEDEQFSWLPATRELIGACLRDGTPVLGICLGAQLMALAAGGTVVPGALGPELGVLPVHLTEAASDDPFASTLPGTFVVPQGHHDAITALPPAAVLLASSRLYANQAFRVGEQAWGVQYHPEVDQAVFDDWMLADREYLVAAGTSREAVMADYEAHEQDLAAVAAAHASAFARVVQHASAGTVRLPA